MKIGDMVSYSQIYAQKRYGVVIHISQPTAMFPYQIAKVAFVDGKNEDIATSVLEVISASR